jgi:hypothetical protein
MGDAEALHAAVIAALRVAKHTPAPVDGGVCFGGDACAAGWLPLTAAGVVLPLPTAWFGCMFRAIERLLASWGFALNAGGLPLSAAIIFVSRLCPCDPIA